MFLILSSELVQLLQISAVKGNFAFYILMVLSVSLNEGIKTKVPCCSRCKYNKAVAFNMNYTHKEGMVMQSEFPFDFPRDQCRKGVERF